MGCSFYFAGRFIRKPPFYFACFYLIVEIDTFYKLYMQKGENQCGHRSMILSCFYYFSLCYPIA